MSRRRAKVKLVPLGREQDFQDVQLTHSEDWTLAELLQACPALAYEPVSESVLATLLKDLDIRVLRREGIKAETPLYRPVDFEVRSEPRTRTDDGASNSETVANAKSTPSKPAEAVDSAASEINSSDDFPDSISESEAVRQAYSREIDKAASFLRAKLPVLIYCEKLVVEHLWRSIVNRSGKEAYLLEVPDEADEGLMPRSLRQRQLAKLKELIRDLKEGHVLVVRHLDLLAGGSDSNLPTESRDLIELMYEAGDRLVLAFTDRTMELPEVLAARFAVRLEISGLWPTVMTSNGEKRLGKALVTKSEAECFEDYDPDGLHKNVAGMNPVRLRHAIGYAVSEYGQDEAIPVAKLYEAIRAFKAQTSAGFEVPKVRWEDIGGHNEVKAELIQAIGLILGTHAFEKRLQAELIPKGFIFYGPPGTGKTLIAKAVANQMNATIQVVSGPEVTDMYVGESERKVRELFSEARRNSPAVMVFDEFDSIAAKRSGREDGGSRAGNALVAQILTEMDGFRPDVPLLVIGTTNRLDIIDEALLRPSRFKAIRIGMPDYEGRRAIAEVHAKHFGIDVSAVLLDVLADATDGMNGDEIRSIFRDACVADRLHGQTVDARFLGDLVGKLRRSAQERTASKTAEQTSATGNQPTGTMTRLTRRTNSRPTESSPTGADSSDEIGTPADSPKIESAQ